MGGAYGGLRHQLFNRSHRLRCRWPIEEMGFLSLFKKEVYPLHHPPKKTKKRPGGEGIVIGSRAALAAPAPKERGLVSETTIILWYPLTCLQESWLMKNSWQLALKVSRDTTLQKQAARMASRLLIMLYVVCPFIKFISCFIIRDEFTFMLSQFCRRGAPFSSESRGTVRILEEAMEPLILPQKLRLLNRRLWPIRKMRSHG